MLVNVRDASDTAAIARRDLLEYTVKPNRQARGRRRAASARPLLRRDRVQPAGAPDRRDHRGGQPDREAPNPARRGPNPLEQALRNRGRFRTVPEGESLGRGSSLTQELDERGDHAPSNSAERPHRTGTALPDPDRARTALETLGVVLRRAWLRSDRRLTRGGRARDAARPSPSTSRARPRTAMRLRHLRALACASSANHLQQKSGLSAALVKSLQIGMELAGVESATSWVQ
jgi:hypothetical protein